MNKKIELQLFKYNEIRLNTTMASNTQSNTQPSSNSNFTIPIPINMSIFQSLSSIPNSTPPYRIENDPTAMIPLLPGESLHVGYIPLTEEEAFNIKTKYNLALISQLGSNPTGLPILIPREKIPHERLLGLIHKFISCTPGATILMPKYTDPRRCPTKALYYASIRYCLYNGLTTYMTVHMTAISQKGEDQYHIEVICNYGQRAVKNQFIENLRIFLDSDGATFIRATHRDTRVDYDQEEEFDNEDNGETGYQISRPPRKVTAATTVAAAVAAEDQSG
jgi:hypothetical protein